MRRSEYSRNTSVIGTLIASVCILVYLGAVVSVIVKVSAGMERLRDEARGEFRVLVNRATSAGAEGFMDAAFVGIVQDTLNESRVLEGVIIHVPGDAYGFEKREGGHAIDRVNGLPRFRERFGLSRHGMFEPIRIPDRWNVSIEAVAAVIDYGELAGTLRYAVLLIAAALVVAFLTLLVESSMRRRQAGEEYEGEEDAGRPMEPSRSGAIREAADAVGTTAGVSGNRPGIYSERAHIVRKEHAEARLAQEMERSAAAGQDVAFIAIEFKSAEADNHYSRLAADAARFFSSREFVCERGERGLSIICPGLSLDMGFLNATEFHNRVLGKYPAVFRQKTDLCMGISARSGRELVNAARLVFEAEEALERALMDPVSHIIAFRVDPDKYRAFMEGRRTVSG